VKEREEEGCKPLIIRRTLDHLGKKRFLQESCKRFFQIGEEKSNNGGWGKYGGLKNEN